MNQIHILNGDALKEQFPKDLILGEVRVARECLVDGPVDAKTLDELIELRAEFINDSFGENYDKAANEIKAINSITEGEVNLWFEEDLFCQVNLWFICSLLYLKRVKVFLVMPKDSLRYGFGGLSQDQLVSTYNNRQNLTQVNVNQFALLWFAYRNNHIERLLKLGVQMHTDFPFVMEAISAHFDRLPNGEKPSVPEQIIRDIIKEKSTQDFGVVFREFCKRAPIFGFGDLQIKRIFDKVINQ
ncbi:DUF1835 domain-containing protein [Ekhidna sp. To15]|uniref:DUF1835 domain-containing protein n=1 Tax=Ekhidna sp. To15 TaxID=3395267 RepID=UPI003F524A54